MNNFQIFHRSVKEIYHERTWNKGSIFNVEVRTSTLKYNQSNIFYCSNTSDNLCIYLLYYHHKHMNAYVLSLSMLSLLLLFHQIECVVETTGKEHADLLRRAAMQQYGNDFIKWGKSIDHSPSSPTATPASLPDNSFIIQTNA